MQYILYLILLLFSSGNLYCCGSDACQEIIIDENILNLLVANVDGQIEKQIVHDVQAIQTQCNQLKKKIEDCDKDTEGNNIHFWDNAKRKQKRQRILKEVEQKIKTHSIPLSKIIKIVNQEVDSYIHKAFADILVCELERIRLAKLLASTVFNKKYGNWSEHTKSSIFSRFK